MKRTDTAPGAPGAPKQRKRMNLPNRLTILRILMVPVFVAVMMLPERLLPADISAAAGVALFILASITDLLDGKIARKRGLITDFGRLMDPLADKFMVIGALTAIVYRYERIRPLYIWVLLIVVFRELAVTSLRLVAASSGGVVVAADMLGKIKTVTQIVCVCAAIIEPLIYGIPAVGQRLPEWWTAHPPLSLLLGLLTILLTVASGANYFRSLWKYLDPEK